MTDLKTQRDSMLPTLPAEVEKDDFGRTTRFRKGQLSMQKDFQENVYDDLKALEAATPNLHKTTHQDGGTDEISVTGLSGLLADDQHVLDTEVLAVAEDKTKKGVASGYADLDGTTKVPIAEMASGTPDGYKFIRDDRTLVYPKFVQHVSNQYNDASNSAVHIPVDDTLPLNTEGYEVMTVTITPKDVNNLLIIKTRATLVGSGATLGITIALFRDSGTCLAAILSSGAAVLIHKVAAGSLSSTTFKIRVGTDAGTIYFNSHPTVGGRIYGDIPKSYIEVIEVTP